MDPDKLKAVIEALKAEDGAAALALLEEMLAGALGAPPAGGGTGDPLAPGAEMATAVEAAVTNTLRELTGCATLDESIVSLRTMRERVARLDVESAALELRARQDLVGELVVLGVEFPATAWEGKPEDRKPVKRLTDEPLADLRARVALHRQARPRVRAPEAGPVPDVKTLSAADLAACKKRGIDPADFLARKASAVRRSA